MILLTFLFLKITHGFLCYIDQYIQEMINYHKHWITFSIIMEDFLNLNKKNRDSFIILFIIVQIVTFMHHT